MDTNYNWGQARVFMITRRRLLGFASAGVFGLPLAACRGGDNIRAPAGDQRPGQATAAPDATAPTAIRKGGVLQIATSVGDPPKLDPHSLLNAGLWDINAIYAEKLLYFDARTTTDTNTAQLVGGLAEQWEQPDTLTAVFTLTNAAWHDKEPVNGRQFVASDVKATLDRVIDHSNNLPVGNLIRDFIDKIEAPDPRTVRVVLRRPFGALFEVLAASAFLVIIPEEGAKGQYDLERTQIGTGSFILTKREPGVVNIYEANRRYRRPVYLDRIEQIAFKDQNALTAAVLSGKLHIAVLAEGTDPSIPPQAIYNTYVVPGNIRYELAINRRFQPFNDQRVRQAMRLAIDQDEILRKAFNGQASFTGIIPPSSPWTFPEPRNRELFKPDLAKSKQLLEAAGFTSYDGVFVHYTTGSQEPSLRATAEVLSAQLAKMGFKMRVRGGDLTTVLQEQYAGNYVTNVRPIAGNTGNGLYDWTYKAEHTNGLYSIHNTKNMPPDEKLNDLCLRAVGAYNKREQDAINEEFQLYLHDRAYFVPTGVPNQVIVVHNDLQGWGYHNSETRAVYSPWAAGYWLKK